MVLTPQSAGMMDIDELDEEISPASSIPMSIIVSPCEHLYWYYRALYRPSRSRIGAKALRKYQDRGD
jgi:hypothetical protein